MGLRTKRWNDPVEKDDGKRILITRFRPRGLRKERENWDEWWKQLAPSAGLLADFHGKDAPPIHWDEYRARYLQEMQGQVMKIAELAERVKASEQLTLLCSAACEDPDFCHRTLLRELVEERLGEKLAPEQRKQEAIPKQFSKLRDWLG
jgi:uncharacterized protein YeaO (DUF488 family)